MPNLFAFPTFLGVVGPPKGSEKEIRVICVIRCSERNVNNVNNKKEFVFISVIRVRNLICVICSLERNVNNKNNRKKFV